MYFIFRQAEEGQRWVDNYKIMKLSSDGKNLEDKDIATPLDELDGLSEINLSKKQIILQSSNGACNSSYRTYAPDPKNSSGLTLAHIKQYSEIDGRNCYAEDYSGDGKLISRNSLNRLDRYTAVPFAARSRPRAAFWNLNRRSRWLKACSGKYLQGRDIDLPYYFKSQINPFLYNHSLVNYDTNGSISYYDTQISAAPTTKRWSSARIPLISPRRSRPLPAGLNITLRLSPRRSGISIRKKSKRKFARRSASTSKACGRTACRFRSRRAGWNMWRCRGRPRQNFRV